MLKQKPPVVVILGHVDHGKTTLLDFLRQTKMAEKEVGGITQKIGAYEIEFEGKKITFIDTPGHEAFNNLRTRGAKIADIGVVVIAADDGVMPQTLESLEILKALNLPFIIAINKIDKSNANPDKVIYELIQKGYLIEGYGGEIPVVKISAKTGKNVDELLKLINLLGEIHNLKYDPEIPGQGYILEASKDQKTGYLATIIPQNGKISYGDFLITSSTFCKIKIFLDQFNHPLKELYPSTPAIIGPFEDLPLAGANFKVGLKEDIEAIKEELMSKETIIRKKITVSSIDQVTSDFNFIIRVDHLGSLEAIENILKNLAQETSKNIKIVKADVGLPTFEDIRLAKQTNSYVIIFNLKLPKQTLQDLVDYNIKYVQHNIIYHLIDDIKKILENKPLSRETKGVLEVLETFSKTSIKKTIGGRVSEGSFRVGNKVNIKRDQFIIGSGKIISLKKEKVSVDEVKSGELCGMQIETKVDIEKGDIIERI